MEENNNNENKVKEIVKDEAKKVGTALLKKIIPAILPAIGIFFLILLAIGVINLIPWLINNMLNSILSIFNPSQPNSALNSNTQSVVEIVEDGTYKLKVEDFSQQILEELENQHIDTDTTGFITENFEDMLDKYIKAEVQTTFPKTGQSDLDGIITIKRASTITGKKDQPLKYVSAKEFNKMLAEGNVDIFNCFSLNPDNFNLWIAKSKDSTVYKDANGNVYKTEGGGIEKEEHEYQKLVQNYSVPLNFFVTLHVLSQDESFMNDVLNLVLGENKEEPIVLTYVDSQQIQTERYDYSGKIILKSEEDGNSELPKINNQNVRKYIDDASEYTEKITTKNAGNLCITKADTWLKTSNIVISQMQSVVISEKLDSTQKTYTKKIPQEVSTQYNPGKQILVEATINVTETITTKSEGKKYTMINGEGKINVDKFVDLIKMYPKVENNLTTSPSNVFYLLQQSEKTQMLEKIMRYILYELNDIDYGVSLTTLQYLLSDKKEYPSSSRLLRDYIRSWEHISLPLTNADGTCYIIETDIEGNLTVGYGVDIEENRYLFEENSYSTELGQEVPIEFVDTIEENKLEELLNEIKALTEGIDLAGCQLNALTSIAHSSGGAIEAVKTIDGKNFMQAYEEYWNPEVDNLYEKQGNEPNMRHLLYTRYISKIKGTYSVNKARRESEWTLFQTGYYDVLYKWHPNTESILEACVTVMNELIAANVRYSLGSGSEKDGGPLPGRVDIKSFDGYGCCCATYVSRVLYVSGVLSADQINSENFHSSGTACSYGVEKYLTKAGWIKVSEEEAQPGDVGIWHQVNGNGTGHVFIYAGDNEVWEQSSGVISTSGAPPTYGTNSNWNSYANQFNLCIYRMP